MTKKKNLSTKQDLCKKQVARLLKKLKDLSPQDAAFVVRTVCDVFSEACDFASFIATNLNQKDGESKVSFLDRKKHPAVVEVMEHIISAFGLFLIEHKDFRGHCKKRCKEVGTSILAKHLFQNYILDTFYQEYGIANVIECICKSEILPKLEAKSKGKKDGGENKLNLRNIFGFEPGLHLVFVRRKSEIRPFLKSIGCDSFYFFDNTKASITQGGSTVCYWNDRRNREFDYKAVIAQKRAAFANYTRVFLFTSVGRAKLEREFPSFTSISTVTGDKDLSLCVEKCQNGPLGTFKLA